MRWTKPKELGREPRAAVRRVRDLIEAATDVALTTFMPTKTRTSLVAVRVINPRAGIRAVGLVERYQRAK